MEIELAACDVIACADHPEKEWKLLEGVSNHLGSNLEEMTIRIFWCGFRQHVDGPDKDAKWIKSFAEEKRDQGINICIVWALLEDDGHRGGTFDYYWATTTSHTSLINLVRRTVWGLYPRIRIWGLPGQHIPNLLVRLTILLADRFMLPASSAASLPQLKKRGSGCQWLYAYFKLETDTKMKKMDNLDDLSRCFGLKLLNREAIEDEEVVIMEAILAKMAKNPRPQMPRTIILPKVNSSHSPDIELN